MGETGRPDKVMTIVYAVGLTHHTTGGQLIRSAALLQLRYSYSAGTNDQLVLSLQGLQWAGHGVLVDDA